MKPPQFEDNWFDVVMKASRGLGRPLDVPGAQALDEDNPPGDSVLHQLALLLDLSPEALVSLARSPQGAGAAAALPAGVTMVSSSWNSMIVNCYVVKTGQGRLMLFDTGADEAALIKAIESAGNCLEAIFITHAHPDHIACLDSLRRQYDCPVHTSRLEPVDDAELFEPGEQWQIDNIRVETRSTRGHSKGGITYVLHGLTESPPLAIVGDAIFSLSMGGGKVDYQSALETNRRNILSLPDDTILCPGHGMPTTVGHEKRHNPFFAAP
jgi:glyoxylase-like metal-dependent hydrolase (beta-lactamase superfamily II)